MHGFVLCTKQTLYPAPVASSLLSVFPEGGGRHTLPSTHTCKVGEMAPLPTRPISPLNPLSQIRAVECHHNIATRESLAVMFFACSELGTQPGGNGWQVLESRGNARPLAPSLCPSEPGGAPPQRNQKGGALGCVRLVPRLFS